MRTETKTQAASVELPDDTAIVAGANYDAANPLWIEDEDPSMHYFFAVDDQANKGRPDGVTMLLRQGYRRSEKKHGSPDCILLEIPKATFEARDRERREREYKLRRAALQPPKGATGVAFDGHGDIRKVK